MNIIVKGGPIAVYIECQKRGLLINAILDRTDNETIAEVDHKEKAKVLRVLIKWYAEEAIIPFKAGTLLWYGWTSSEGIWIELLTKQLQKMVC